MPPVIGAGFLGIEHFTPPWDVFFLPLFNLLIFFYNLLFSDFAPVERPAIQHGAISR